MRVEIYPDSPEYSDQGELAPLVAAINRLAKIVGEPFDNRVESVLEKFKIEDVRLEAEKWGE